MPELKGYAGQFFVYSDSWTPVARDALGTGNGVLTQFWTANRLVDYQGFVLSVSDEVSDVAKGWLKDYDLTADGRVTLHSAPALGTVKAAYNYSTGTIPAGGFTGWGIDVGCDVLDTTNFNSTGWKAAIAGTRQWSGKAEKHWILGSDVWSQMGKGVIVRFYTDEAAGRFYTGWAKVSGANPSSGVDTLVNEPISFQGVDQLCTGSDLS